MLVNQGLSGEALRLLSRALSQSPGDARLVALASDLYLKLGKDAEAAAALAKAHALDPENDDLTFRYARVLARCERTQEAIDLLARLLERTPDALMPLRLYGDLCFQTGQLQFALEAFTRISELKPRSPEGHLLRVRCLHTLLLWDEAKEAALVGLSQCPDSADLRLALGQVYFDQGQDEQALQTYEEILQSNEHHAALIGKGRCLQRIGGEGCPASVARRAIELNPKSIEAYRLLSSVQRSNRDYDGAVETLRRGIETSDAQGEARGHACIELAQAHDKAGRFDDAFDSVEEAHKHLAPAHVSETHHWKNYVARLLAWRESPGASEVSTWSTPRVSPSGASTPAFLIGFPRSGTTLVEQMIGSLEGWITSDERPMLAQLEGALARKVGVPLDELRGSLGQLSDKDIEWARAWYAELCEFHLGPEAATAKVLDKQPYNTPTLALIRRVFPEAKTLVALRDPRDVCLSVIMQDVTPNRGMRHYPTIDAVARVYDAMMGLYLIDRDRLGLCLHEFRYEDVIADTEGQLRRVVEFLGEPWTDSVLEYTRRAQQRRSRINSESVKKEIYSGSIARWKHYEHRIGHVFPTLEPYREKFGYT